MEKLIRLITVQDVSDFVKTVSEKCKHTVVWDDGLADISEIHWGEEMKNIIEDEEKYYDMSNKSRY